ncbi:ribokinase [Evansella tamaricis]|uniref:Ribokinase n=1 Tax=Evansella tamaricis TaxID=2069301 RepID=A0ABS6JCB5_9BACI|nr:ribokinase [Evansella tamaricis]MBU9711221.1 ribokinase [Evansella tamaricis]
MENKPLITVIGSINMDMVTMTDKVPVQGETLLGESFKTYPGGKGANQAVAAARLGGRVQMIGKVGNDAFGDELRNNLNKEGVSVDCVEASNVGSGVATIILSDNDNRIIVIPGANNEVTPEFVKKYEQNILASSLVVLQFEIPVETVKFCLQLCHEHQIPVILNPAPARKMEEGDWIKATYITPNETEEEDLFSHLREKDDVLSNKLIVTMGDKGVNYIKDGEVRNVPAYKVNPLDTTGAGDTFNGALAVALGEKMELRAGLEFANGAAALSVQRFGAQGGMPTREELELFLKSRRGNE